MFLIIAGVLIYSSYSISKKRSEFINTSKGSKRLNSFLLSLIIPVIIIFLYILTFFFFKEEFNSYFKPNSWLENDLFRLVILFMLGIWLQLITITEDLIINLASLLNLFEEKVK